MAKIKLQQGNTAANIFAEAQAEAEALRDSIKGEMETVSKTK